MTAHQHWVFSITTTHLLAIVRRLPTATVPPAPLPIPLGCFPLNTKSTAEAQLTAQSTAEQSQQSSWDSQASPGQAGPRRCRTPAMTYRWKSCWVWWLHEPPDQSPRLRPGWRNTITKTAKTQQFVTAERGVGPCLLWCLQTEQLCGKKLLQRHLRRLRWDSGFCQEIRQTTGVPLDPCMTRILQLRVLPEQIFPSRGNHKQTSGTPLLLARNFQWGTSYKATLLTLLL